MNQSSGTSPGHYRPMQAGALVGVGFIAAIDELVFHQLLGWHHFYDLSTSFIGLFSDGILHAAELICLVAGFTLLISLQRTATLSLAPVMAGFFCGMGAFQLFDGLINHKILKIHQIRYRVDILPYDILWNLVAVLFLLTGIWLSYRHQKSRAKRAFRMHP